MRGHNGGRGWFENKTVGTLERNRRRGKDIQVRGRKKVATTDSVAYLCYPETRDISL